jgi:predicted dehydrogenase
MNILIIGCGKMGLSHCSIFNSHPSIEKVYIDDTNKALLSQIYRHTNLHSFDECLEDFICSNKIHGVVIATPTQYHYEFAKLAILSNKICFIEKPFTSSFTNSSDLYNLACSRNTPLLCGYVNRFNPIINLAKKLLNNGSIGKIVHYHNRMTGCVVKSSNSISTSNSNTSVNSAMIEYGSHAINLALFFFGHPFNMTISAKRSIFSKNSDDYGEIILHHTNSIIGSNTVNWCDLTQRKAFNSIEIWGDKGFMKITKQTLQLYSESENCDDGGCQKGWNTWTTPEIVKGSDYYLRGEDYSLQAQSFVNLMKKSGEWKSAFVDAVITDEILNFYQNNNMTASYENFFRR